MKEPTRSTPRLPGPVKVNSTASAKEFVIWGLEPEASHDFGFFMGGDFPNRSRRFRCDRTERESVSRTNLFIPSIIHVGNQTERLSLSHNGPDVLPANSVIRDRPPAPIDVKSSAVSASAIDEFELRSMRCCYQTPRT